MTDNDNPLNLTQEILGEVVGYSFQAQQLEAVNDSETAEAARLLRAKLKSVESKIEQARVAAKAPFLQSAKQIDGLANVIFDQIRPQIKRIDDMRLAYSQKFTQPAMPVVPAPAEGVDGSLLFGTPPDMSQLATGISAEPPVIRTMKRKDIEIVDPAQVPDEFWVIDEVKLRAAVLRDGRDVLGVRVIEKTTVLE